MAKGKIVTPEVEGLIKTLYLNKPKMKAKDIRNFVESELRTDDKYSKLWPIPEGWPGLSKVQKVLAEFKKEESKLSDEYRKQDEPWDISTLDKYPIPWEAVPVVLHLSMSSKQPLTIREAKWIGRLYGLFSTIASQQGLNSADWIGDIAAFYATSERISKLMDERVPPTMDQILWEFLTKQESVTQVAKRGFNPGADDDRWVKTETGELYFQLTEKELAWAEELWRKLGYSKPFRHMSDPGSIPEVKETKNERQHKTKRQK